MSDIPLSQWLVPLGDDVAHPEGERYTLQWLIIPSATKSQAAKSNIDAFFVKDKDLPKPSGLLLHYIYGAAAVKQWGQDTQAFVKRLNVPRPAIPAPPISRPPTTRHSRTVTIQKRSGAGPADEGGGTNQSAGGGNVLGAYVPPKESLMATDSEESLAANDWSHTSPEESLAGTDWSPTPPEGFLAATDWPHIPPEEILVAENWSRTPASRERHFQAKKAERDYVDHWRQGVAVSY